jgi:hypothetical protein
MLSALLVTALLVTALVETPLRGAAPPVSGRGSAWCEVRDGDATGSWPAVLDPCHARGLVAPPLTFGLTVDRGPAVRVIHTQPVFRLRDPPIRTSR